MVDAAGFDLCGDELVNPPNAITLFRILLILVFMTSSWEPYFTGRRFAVGTFVPMAQ